jgi:MFS family permease
MVRPTSTTLPGFLSKERITASAPGDWKISTLGWMNPLVFVLLGSSAALLGVWVEREGPRKAGVVAAVCWGSRFFVSALGTSFIDLAVVARVGRHRGMRPRSRLHRTRVDVIKWFPDRRGMATGLAIMGFGGGAMIGTPLADSLMRAFQTPTSVGVWRTFVVMGTIYFVAMLCGAFGYRLPPPGWMPSDWTPTATAQSSASRRAREHRVAHEAMLAALGSALPQRHRRHWRALAGLPLG